MATRNLTADPVAPAKKGDLSPVFAGKNSYPTY